MLQTQNKNENDPNIDPTGSPSKKVQASSPVKGVMAALSKHRVSQEPLPSNIKSTSKIAGLEVPKTIEDVPFRRQDRRILNARKKRIIARRIIGFGVFIAVLLILTGAALIALYIIYHDDKDFWFVNPFIIVGIVVVVCGIMFGAFTVETCIWLRAASARVTDKDIDSISNLHLIKHWIEPELVPFGWGHDTDGNPHIVGKLEHIEHHVEHHILNITEIADDTDPHLAMKMNIDDDIETNPTNIETDPIPKEIFDESLRYSKIDRPRFSISKSSPLPQRRGSFSDPNEKIANLFNTS